MVILRATSISEDKIEIQRWYVALLKIQNPTKRLKRKWEISGHGQTKIISSNIGDKHSRV